MEIIRFVNQQEIEGALPDYIIENPTILSVLKGYLGDFQKKEEEEDST